MCCFGSPDLCCDKWACKKPTDFLDESAQFQELREDDNSASEITYGEVEQRLGQLQEHLNRYMVLQLPPINYELLNNGFYTSV